MNSRMRSLIRSPLLALALVAVFAGTAVATVAIDFGPPVPVAKGTMSESVRLNTGLIKFQTKGPVVFNTVSITIKPGGTSGWHSHPGLAIVTVKQGSVTFYDQSCEGTVHPAGTSFIEAVTDGPGQARNEGTTDAIVYVTFIAPANTTVFRVDKANPCVDE